MRSLIATVPIFFALLGLTACERYALDRQMDELCKKDGGAHIYETVTLPAELFDSYGDPFPGWQNRAMADRLGPDYRLLQEVKHIKNGEPLKGEGRLTRSLWRVIRLADGKLLGEAVMYGRSGGDLVVLDHFSSKVCPQHFGEASALVRGVFLKKG